MRVAKRILIIFLVFFMFLFSSISYGAYSSHSGSNTIRFVSSDITNYPRVRLYYKIYDSSGRVVSNFRIKSVVLWEKIAGGDYLQREVRSHEMLSESSGLSTSLVIDKYWAFNCG